MKTAERLALGLGWIAILAASASHAADVPAIELIGKGVQIYTCQAAGAEFAWKFRAPDAILMGRDGAAAGRHFAGPSWQASDGSTIVGEALVSSPSPHAGSVPWLVLRAKSVAGPGLFSNVTYVTRTQTEGGAAPVVGCDAGHLGKDVRVPYSATYTLFIPPGSPAH